MPTSAPGNNANCANTVQGARRAGCGRRPRGFTLIEVMVVMAIVAVAMAVVSLAIRDPAESQLEREAARLVALLEGARAEARLQSASVRWVPAGAGVSTPFRFDNLPDGKVRPTQWLDDRVRAQVVGATSVVLGPEPILPAQRIMLSLEDRRLEIASDGLSAFAIAGPSAAGDP